MTETGRCVWVKSPDNGSFCQSQRGLVKDRNSYVTLVVRVTKGRRGLVEEVEKPLYRIQNDACGEGTESDGDLSRLRRRPRSAACS